MQIQFTVAKYLTAYGLSRERVLISVLVRPAARQDVGYSGEIGLLSHI
jgi:hypothetical protein